MLPRVGVITLATKVGLDIQWIFGNGRVTHVWNFDRVTGGDGVILHVCRVGQDLLRGK